MEADPAFNLILHRAAKAYAIHYFKNYNVIFMGCPKKVLLVDDEKINHFVNTKVLSLTGVDCEIQTASNGQEALLMLSKFSEREHFPDLILVDLNMPVMGGFQFIESLQTSLLPGKKISVIVLTSSFSEVDKQRARELGVPFISKPLSIEEAKTIVYSLN